MRCFRMRGKKGKEHRDPFDPPRRRANKRRGKGTYDNDRPPIVGTVGRESGQVRLRVVKETTGETLVNHVPSYSLTNQPVTITLFALMPLFVTARMNGKEMTMVMAFEKFMSTPLKRCGQT